jgi:hypothetical protein
MFIFYSFASFRVPPGLGNGLRTAPGCTFIAILHLSCTPQNQRKEGIKGGKISIGSINVDSTLTTHHPVSPAICWQDTAQRMQRQISSISKRIAVILPGKRVKVPAAN